MKLKITGTIVSADYDDPFFATWIDKGIITPSSRVVAALESLPEGEGVDLFVNSYGGDVFAGAEMLIALEKAHAAGRLQGVEVGALAASMAANIVAALKARGAKVTAYANTTLMFHGCYTVTEGGAQHHEDVADSLRNINETVIADLNRLGITDCRAWFAEGREKWLTAKDAQNMGIFDEIANSEGAQPAAAMKTASRLAAFAAKVKTRMEYQMELDETIKAAENAEANPETVETPAKTPQSDENAPVDAPQGADKENPAPSAEGVETPSGASDEAWQARLAGLQAAKDKEIAALKAQSEEMRRDSISALAATTADYEAKITEFQTEIDTKAKALDAANAEIEQLKAEVERQTTALAETQAALEREKEAHLAAVGKALKPEPTTALHGKDLIRSRFVSGK